MVPARIPNHIIPAPLACMSALRGTTGRNMCTRKCAHVFVRNGGGWFGPASSLASYTARAGLSAPAYVLLRVVRVDMLTARLCPAPSKLWTPVHVLDNTWALVWLAGSCT